jgi:fumarate reductase subunit D
MARQRILEPFLWLLFGAGGMASALLMPVLILLFGLAFPLGWAQPPEHAALLALFRSPLVRLALLLLLVFSLFHYAHRFRYTLYDALKVKHLSGVIDPLCYGSAVVGSLVAAYLVLQV